MSEYKLFEAIRENNIEKIKNFTNINAKDYFGYTALMRAASKGDLEIVKCLVESGADINAKNSSGWTALMGVSSWKNGHLGIVKYLLKNGADINAKDNNGNTALIKASKFGKLEIIKYLVEDKRLDINIKNNDGKTALDLSENEEIKEVLIKAEVK